MKKILIVGSKGMAGHMIYLYLKSLNIYIVEDISRNDQHFTSAYHADVTDLARMEAILEKANPDYVINCVGVLNQDAEQHPEKSVFLNAYFPHFLATQAEKNKGRLIHISTDCVFNGKKGSYVETDPKDGIGFYAQSKALGEVTYRDHLTIRTSIIGPELKTDGIGLFDWFMKQQDPIKGYTGAWWSGVTTLALAQAIPAVIDQQVNGLIHLVNGSRINKYELLGLFKKLFGKDIVINPYDGYSVDKSLLDTRKALSHAVPGYEEMISAMKDWINSNRTFYPGYVSAS